MAQRLNSRPVNPRRAYAVVEGSVIDVRHIAYTKRELRAEYCRGRAHSWDELCRMYPTLRIIAVTVMPEAPDA